MTAVITVNEGDYGIACVFNTAYDLSAFTDLTIEFIKPDLTVLNGTATAPNVDLVTVLGTFPANMYAQYYFQAGDLDQTGIWSARVLYTESTASPSLYLVSNSSTFMVTP